MPIYRCHGIILVQLVNSEGDEIVFTHYDYVVIHVNDSGQIISWTKLFLKFLEGGGGYHGVEIFWYTTVKLNNNCLSKLADFESPSKSIIYYLNRNDSEQAMEKGHNSSAVDHISSF